MSKYTTEVRYICEVEAGLEESTGFNNVNQVLQGSWNKIFTSTIEFFDETYRSVICQKILKHYYLREICAETVGIWKLWMNTKLEEIMPYYNQLYKSALIDFNPMYDVELTTEHGRETDETRNETTNRATHNTGSSDTQVTGNNSRNTTETANNGHTDLYSDTPQGAITDLENMTYLTNARKIEEDNSITGTETGNNTQTTEGSYEDNGTDNYSGNNTINSTENYIETVKGKQGGSSYSEMLNQFRSTMLNIDMQVIDEFSNLFFNLY